jgi:hypothetical protein
MKYRPDETYRTLSLSVFSFITSAVKGYNTTYTKRLKNQVIAFVRGTKPPENPMRREGAEWTQEDHNEYELYKKHKALIDRDIKDFKASGMFKAFWNDFDILLFIVNRGSSFSYEKKREKEDSLKYRAISEKTYTYNNRQLIYMVLEELELFASQNPEMALFAKQELNEIINEVLSPLNRKIALDILKGLTPQEVSSKRGVTKRTVKNVMDRVLINFNKRKKEFLK